MIESFVEIIHAGHPVKITPEHSERFMGKIDRGGPSVYGLSQCWNWMGGKTTGGYGTLWIDGFHVAAHRVSYAISIGKIQDGMCVLHRCDNRACVNPEHLFLGSISDNNKDRDEKGRGIFLRGEDHWSQKSPHLIKRGQDHWSSDPAKLASALSKKPKRRPETFLRGEMTNFSKLKEVDVIEIRKLRSEGKSLSAIAKIFNVRETTISMISNRKTWTHVE